MSISLPGNHLFYLSYDNLEPERFELITQPSHAWHHICEEYEFDDHYRDHYFIQGLRPKINGQQRYKADRRWGTESDTEHRLRHLVEAGDVVMLNRHGSPGELFYIDNNGELTCRDTLAFRFNGWTTIIREYRRSVACRDYRQSGGKPRPTRIIRYGSIAAKAPVESAQQLKTPEIFGTINSKTAGRLLAAGGIYNQNPEMFADTARKLGGEAVQGFDQVLNEQTAGSLVALSSIAAIGRGAIHPTSMSEIEKLNNFLGNYRKSPVLLKNIEVVKIQYVKRPPEESRLLRSAFDNGIRRKFVKSIADNSDVVERLNRSQRAVLAKGGVPDGYQVHHKFPLDDSGTNDFNNLVLIKNEGIHPVFTNAQANISRLLVPGGDAPTVLWPKPKGVIYP